jgi:hypothetical protein
MIDDFFPPGRAAAMACYLTTSAGAARSQKGPLPPFFDRARRMR